MSNFKRKTPMKKFKTLQAALDKAFEEDEQWKETPVYSEETGWCTVYSPAQTAPVLTSLGILLVCLN
jgi:hypothetical protein